MRTQRLYLRKGGYITVEWPDKVSPWRLAAVWTRFHRNPTLFQQPGSKHGDGIVPDPRQGFATHHRMPVLSAELGGRVFSQMEMNPLRQIRQAVTRAEELR